MFKFLAILILGFSCSIAYAKPLRCQLQLDKPVEGKFDLLFDDIGRDSQGLITRSIQKRLNASEMLTVRITQAAILAPSKSPIYGRVAITISSINPTYNVDAEMPLGDTFEENATFKGEANFYATPGKVIPIQVSDRLSSTVVKGSITLGYLSTTSNISSKKASLKKKNVL